jgi:uncharacterized protein (DUF2461 family)
MFQGFTPETDEFLWGIRLNNSREWFMPRKSIYVEQVYEPLKELAYQVQEDFLNRCPGRQFNCKVTRIYRDVRIPRKDGPYKTTDGGGYSVGMDFYCGKPALMEQFRQAVLDDPKPVRKLARELNRHPEFQLGGPEYKRSKGTVEELLQPWFNRKSLYVERQGTPEEGMYTPELAQQIVEDFIWLLPFHDYFKQFKM